MEPALVCEALIGIVAALAMVLAASQWWRAEEAERQVAEMRAEMDRVDDALFDMLRALLIGYEVNGGER